MSLAPDAAFTFGVSIITDAISGVLMDFTGRIRAAFEDSFDVSSRRAVVEHLKVRLEVMARTGGVPRDRIFGVGVATTGYFVAEAAVNTPSGMDEWALVDLEEALAEALDLPVWLENDGNDGAAGESLFAAGQRYASFAYLHIARGLGGGVVLDGQLLRGANGNAGEFTGILPPSERANRPTLALLQDILQEYGIPRQPLTQMVRAFDPSWPVLKPGLRGRVPRLRRSHRASRPC